MSLKKTGVDGKTVMITGGGGGVGAEVARRLHAIGARLLLTDVDRSALAAVTDELGRERVLSPAGRDLAAERWYTGDHGPTNPMTQQAPALCETCGFFVALSGRFGEVFGVCANEYSPSDGSVVSRDHGCGGHSDAPEPRRGVDLAQPIWDTITVDEALFD